MVSLPFSWNHSFIPFQIYSPHEILSSSPFISPSLSPRLSLSLRLYLSADDPLVPLSWPFVTPCQLTALSQDTDTFTLKPSGNIRAWNGTETSSGIALFSSFFFPDERKELTFGPELLAYCSESQDSKIKIAVCSLLHHNFPRNKIRDPFFPLAMLQNLPRLAFVWISTRITILNRCLSWE